MVARKRQVEMSEVQHRSANLSVMTYYDREKKEFHGTYAGKPYCALTEDEVRKAVYAAIEESLNVPWTPIIRISPLKPLTHNDRDAEYYIGFRLNRQWVTQFPGGQYKCCEQWEGNERGQLLNWCKDFAWSADRDGP